MLYRVIVSILSLMAFSIVMTVWGNSSWQLDFGQTGRVGEETRDTLWLLAGLSVDILMLDMVGVIVISAVEIAAEALMFQRVSVSWMTASSRDEIVKLVSCVRWVAD
jgi:hypothetical protein